MHPGACDGLGPGVCFFSGLGIHGVLFLFQIAHHLLTLVRDMHHKLGEPIKGVEGLSVAAVSYQIKRLLALHAIFMADVKILLGSLNEWFLWGRPLR